MKRIKLLLFFAGAAYVLFACGNSQETNEQEKNLIEITNQQYTTDAMQLGGIETQIFESTVKCNGIMVPLPNGMAKANAPINGIVKGISCYNGQSVQPNQQLIEITGNEIIDLQKEFAEASANFKRLNNEYERIQTLYNEKVTSEKDFILAETDFKTSMAKYNGLRLKIEAIGLSASKIENGEFYSSYFIKSPIKGTISNLKVNIGSYIDSQTELLDIINPDMFQIKLSVFVSDITYLRKGQSVRFKSVNSYDTSLSTITSIGVAVDYETKTIDCYASIPSKNLINPIANEFIEAEIITNTDTLAALPTSAIIKNETGDFILVLNKKEDEKYLFDKIEVKLGRQYKGYTEILEPKIDGLIITNGVYNISL